jgi:cobalamin transport system substrate-binding protein
MDLDRVDRSTPSVPQRRGSTRVRRLSRTPVLPLVALLLVAGLLVAACSAAVSPTVTPTAAHATATPLPTAAPTAATPTATPATVTAAADFPVTLTDDHGTRVVIPAEPQRIVSLAPAGTEIVFALGAGGRLAAGTDADDYPAQAAALPHAVEQTQVLKEQIASLQPDLILAYGFTPAGDVQQLRGLGFPVLVLDAMTLDGVEADIGLIGAAIGVADQAAAILSMMTAQLAEIEAAIPAADLKPRAFYEIGYGPDIYAPAAGSPYAEAITLAGGDPITTDASYVISLEQLVEADPQVILLGDAAYGTCPADVAARDGWGQMTAVRDGAIRPVWDEVVTRPGPRIPLGVASLVRALHPDVTLPADLPPDPPLCAGP